MFYSLISKVCEEKNENFVLESVVWGGLGGGGGGEGGEGWS